MTWSNTPVLVTGAGGFIGSHLTERLVRDGATVRAFVRYNSMGRAGWLDDSPLRKEIDIVAGDLRDQSFVRRAVRGQQIVFHLGALIAIPYSYHAPASYVETNVIGTLNLLEAVRDFGVERFVHTSTSEVYGTALRVPIDEAHPLQAQSPYAASKIGADKLAESFHRSFNTPVVTIRPFNTFGPRQSARAVIPTIISQCLAGERIRLGNLHPTRDFNYVENTVDGFCQAAVTPEAVGRTINLGSGREISIGDLTTAIAAAVGRQVEVVAEDARTRPEKSEVDRLLADNRLAASLLGWQPRVSLEEGLRRTIAWLQEHVHQYRPETYSV